MGAASCPLSAPHLPEKFADFREILKRVAQHPNRKYFVFKSIVVNNLYGVDIMEEAVEICKLRLFLKLVAQIERPEQIEPLPDIDFNIRAGNTLVGYVRLEDVQSPIGSLPFPDEEKERIRGLAAKAAAMFSEFRRLQTDDPTSAQPLAGAKEELRRALGVLSSELSGHLAREYGIQPGRKAEYAQWLASHQPFHWFSEFYGIMKAGGFDVVVGNPPYVEYSTVRQDYRILGFVAEECGNLYAMCAERAFAVLGPAARFGFIVQAPIVSTTRMAAVRRILTGHSDFLACATFDDRPAKLFGGMHHCRLAIILSRRAETRTLPTLLTTRYHKWYEQERPFLFHTLAYLAFPPQLFDDFIPKVRSDTELGILRRLGACPSNIGKVLSPKPTPHRLYYKITGVGHWFTFTTEPPKFWRGGRSGHSTRESYSSMPSAVIRDTVFCVLWSTFHYWLYQARTNCRDFNPSDLGYPPLPTALASGIQEGQTLQKELTDCLESTSGLALATYKVGGTVKYQKFRPSCAKTVIDKIDCVLAKHYGFTPEELDFIINYDIKYRMGGDAGEEAGE